MNADDFYEEFKDSLSFLGLKWGEKGLASVSIEGDSIVYSYGTKSARIHIGSNVLSITEEPTNSGEAESLRQKLAAVMQIPKG